MDKIILSPIDLNELLNGLRSIVKDELQAGNLNSGLLAKTCQNLTFKIILPNSKRKPPRITA